MRPALLILAAALAGCSGTRDVRRLERENERLREEIAELRQERDRGETQLRQYEVRYR